MTLGSREARFAWVRAGRSFFVAMSLPVLFRREFCRLPWLLLPPGSDFLEDVGPKAHRVVLLEVAALMQACG